MANRKSSKILATINQQSMTTTLADNSFIKKIYNAQERLRGVAIKTPLKHDTILSEKLACNVYFKQENLQEIRSYKIRGAYNLMFQLQNKKGETEVVCASAGNHAQGVAYASRLLKMEADIFMPTTTPMQKIEQVKMFGGNTIRLHLKGDCFDDSLKSALSHAKKHNQPLIPPFDNHEIIAGQGTVGLEILEQANFTPDFVVVPVGGGGLAAGIAQVLSQLSPKTKLITVEPEGAPSLKNALSAGKPVELETINPFVDGAAVKCIGKKTFELLHDKIHKHILVPEGKICTTLLETYNKAGMVLEPAGALSIAALPQIQNLIGGKSVVCVLTGGNNDITRMEEIRERSLLHEGFKHYFLVRFPQRAGALMEFANYVLEPGQDITHFEYVKRRGKEKGSVVLGIELNKPKEHNILQNKMSKHNFSSLYLNNQPELFDLLI